MPITITMQILIVLLISSINKYAVAQEIQMKKTFHDFGNLATLDYPPAVFEFKNTGDKPLAILVIQKGKDVNVHFERRYYQPGEPGIIQVYHQSGEPGKFKEELSIITNASEKPVIISIKGEWVSVLNCFPDQNNLNLRLISIIDKLTKKPVPGAELHLIHNKQENINVKVDKRGKTQQQLETGLYGYRILAPGYERLENTLFLEKSVPHVYFELEPENEHKKKTSTSFMDNNKQRLDPPGVSQINELSRDQYAENNIVLLIDVSLSMKNNQKLELLKPSMKMLIEVLRDIDRVSLITYSSFPKVHVSSVPGNENQTLNEIINGLNPQGITNGVKGLEKAYEIAKQNHMVHGNNQVILATDGKFSGDYSSVDIFTNLIMNYSRQGIIMSVIGFGSDDKALNTLKEMAGHGDGSFYHISMGSNINDIMVNEIKQNSQLMQ